MRLRDHDMPLDPEVERELAAVDAGLLGLDVTPDLEDLAELARDARGVSTAPHSDFAAKLDEWAAAGFPRDGRLGSGGEGERGSAPGGLRQRLQSVPPRRLLLSAGVAATLLVAAAVGISVSDQLGGSSQTGSSIQGLPGSVPESSRTQQDGNRASGQLSLATHSRAKFDRFQPAQPKASDQSAQALPNLRPKV